MKPSTSPSTSSIQRSPRGWAVACLAGMLAALGAGPVLAVTDVSQSPLYIGSNVPGNLALVPSVEFPTLISVANFGNYSAATTYVGYFDSEKCYRYVYDVVEANRYFEPTGYATNHACDGLNLWSGNYMNWAATQTIDPFRSALTGGYRVRDTTTETFLEKAIGDRASTSNFPRRTTNGNALVGGATPGGSSVFNGWSGITTRVDGLGNKMRFSNSGDLNGGTPVEYNPSIHYLTSGFPPFIGDTRGVIFEVSVRVKVCVPGMLEGNCKQYGSNYKPEGLIQQYSDRIRYSIFGYLNNGGGTEPDGGVLRANQKFVGPQTYNPEDGVQTNANAEWDESTGVLIRNPNPLDATATNAGIAGTNIADSGVINYLNKFGQMNTGRTAKSYDNVSELFYTATRYFRNLGNVPSYSTMSTNGATRRQEADGFPVITNWQDPMRYHCQANVILGIGDTNTWRDKNLPGNTSAAGEPTKAPEVVADTTVDVVADMRRIWLMEGYSAADATTRSTAAAFNGNNNSGYIAALAYAAHTRDIRPDLANKQTISTYWVDVVEANDYKGKATNQYWLAAKYGGFNVPSSFNPDTYPDAPLAADRALPNAWWWTTGEVVNNNAGYQRPDNFYVASEASKMVESLRRAFERIVAEMVGSGSSFASSTTRLESGAKTFQAQFFSGTWRGDIRAFDVNASTGALTLSWSASDVFSTAATNNANHWQSRNIKVNSGGTLRNFRYSQLTGAQQGALGSDQVVDYLRGDRSLEFPNGSLRARTGLIGDIVNSEPVYVGAPNSRLYINAGFSGASTYPAFVAAQASRTPVVYVGANDGMLHGFNANTGAETFAFVPSGAVTAGLRSYTARDYVHQYFVDGDQTVADVFDGTAWRTILVGTLGRGGRSVYALDVTNPSNVSLLWERTPSKMGQALGKPVIAQISSGQWRVFLGNGPNSSGNDRASLLVGSLFSGDFDEFELDSLNNNGLSSVNVWASTSGGYFDTVFAGDQQGRLWKIAFAPASGSRTSLSTKTAIFTAQQGAARQPITATPLAARDPATTQTWVYFGTGKYLGVGDIADRKVQTWYGLKVPTSGTIPTNRSTLRELSILAEGEVSGYTVRAISDFQTSPPDGWYLNLVSPNEGAQGERMIVPNRFQGLALVGTSRIPDANDVCSPSGKGFVMALNPFTGGRLPQSFFDVNNDGSFTDTINGLPVSGIGLPSSPNNPIFLGDVMQVSLDDGSSRTMRTNSSVMDSKRVSWRELVRD